MFVNINTEVEIADYLYVSLSMILDTIVIEEFDRRKPV
mgnify:CR=1 FL=1